MTKVKLKDYVDIVGLDDRFFIISNSFGKESIYVTKDKNSQNLLRDLKSKDGVDSDIYKDDPLYSRLLRNSLIEESYYPSKRRNELFFDYIQTGFNLPLNKRILVLGAGAAGGTISYLLSQQGFRYVFTLDNDKVENSDIEKTMVYDHKDIGEYKVISLQRKTEENFRNPISPILKRINTFEDINHLVSDLKPSIIIYAIDPDAFMKINLNRFCVDRMIPIIHGSYSFDKIVCGPCVIPQQTSCYVGYNEYWKAKTHGMFDYGRTNKLFRETTIHPSISFNINVLASIIVKDVIFALTDDYDRVMTKNKIIELSLISSDIVSYELSCQFCASCKNMYR